MRMWVISLAVVFLLVATGAGVWTVCSSVSSAMTEMKSVLAEAKADLVQAREVLKQTRLAVMSVHGMSFDVRKNWTSNTELQTQLTKKTVDTLERMAASVERLTAKAGDGLESGFRELSATMLQIRERVIPATAQAAVEFGNTNVAVRKAVEDVSKETCGAIAEVKPVLQATERSITKIGDETAETVASVQPVMENVNGVMGNFNSVSKRADNVAAHYEKLILHPDWKQKLKGVFQMILSGFNVWADAKVLF